MRYPDPNRMMTYDEFAITRKNTPYVFELELSGGQRILYYGSRHSQNPNDPMFEDIRSRFASFNPDIIFTEGNEGLNSPEGRKRAREFIEKQSEDETIIHDGGEAGFIVRLALESGIDIESPELSYGNQIEYALSRGYSRDEVFVFMMVRFLVQLQRYPKDAKRPSVEEYAAREFRSLKLHAAWEGFEFSLPHFYESFASVISRPFDIEDPNLSDIVDPIPWPSKKEHQLVTNDIARAVSTGRDEYMLRRIAEVLQNHRRLFIVYGSGHAIKQEPALRAYAAKAE